MPSLQHLFKSSDYSFIDLLKLSIMRRNIPILTMSLAQKNQFCVMVVVF